jgi:hypothetical protein
VVNPHLRVSLEPNAKGQYELATTAPVRGSGLKTLRITEQTHPRIFLGLANWLCRAETRHAPPGETSPRLADLLRKYGLVIPSHLASNPVAFSCPWSELDQLETSALWEFSRNDRLRNWLQLCDRFADPNRMPVPREVALGAGPLVWVRQAVAEIWLPFEANAEELEVLRARSGCAVGQLPSRLQHRLSVAARCVQLQPISESGQLWANVPALLRDPLLASIQRYARQLVDEGWLQFDDGQSARYVAYKEPLLSFLQQCLTPLITQIVGEPVKPSYCYLGAYVPGAKLEIHTDRPQCEYSLSLLLDFQGHQPWPLKARAAKAADTLVFTQQPGDAVMYRGTRLPHFRDELPDGCRSTSVFLHYVGAQYTGDLT